MGTTTTSKTDCIAKYILDMDSQIFRMVAFIESRLTPFAVSRLIMMSGVPVRKYSRQSKDDPQDLRKVQAALKSMLSVRDLSELDTALGL